MTLDRSKMTDKGYLEGDASAVGQDTVQLVADYKKDVCKAYISLNPTQVDTRLGGTKYQVTRKYDGELAVIFYSGDELFTINTGGKVRAGLPCHDAALAALQASGLKSAVIPAELFVAEDAGRTRVFDVLAALADKKRLGELRLAPFEIISLDGVDYQPGSYTEVHAKLTELFTGSQVAPVRMREADSRGQVKEIFEQWVGAEGAEGLVVRCELPLVYKVKPVYTVDVVVVGYSESAETKGLARSMLVAMMTDDGRYQVVGHVGGGFSDTARKQWFDRLAPQEVESSYIETDSNHVAFHMVAPTTVIEVKVNDVLFENTSGPLVNPILSFDGAWSRLGQARGIAIISPVFERVREDKQATPDQVRLSQIEEFMSWPTPAATELGADVAASTVLRRAVFRKELGDKLMVMKFLVWKTNKEKYGYPAYVFSYTNFSSDRADPLATEVRISSDEAQILRICEEFQEKNVKKGWHPVSG
ncbi:MAG: hypothetical protein LBR58_00050 [Propionibacteriaceae bacterium]|jgi:hypothetical protein|nr:hypothetical protein [Propionibacteriaceae bacterium]